MSDTENSSIILRGDGDKNLLPAPMAKAQFVEALDSHWDQRQAFREWLFPKLEEGVHFGFPPGCSPKTNRDGIPVDFKGNVIKTTEWKFKRSLYAAGAEMVRDFFQLQDNYVPDELTWTMLGKKIGTVVRRCDLSRRPGSKFFQNYPDCAIVATGTGAYEVGGKTDANAAIKMADKCALVAAVINVGALRDLFTQDVQPMAPPQADPNAPKAPTRAERTMNPPPDLADALNALTQHYKRFIGREVTRAEFSAWAAGVLGVRDRDFSKLSNWSMDCIAKCEDELNV